MSMEKHRLQRTLTADRVTDAVPTPCSPDTALDRAQRLAICMTRLEPSIGELLPDVRQVSLLSTKEVDALSTSDLRIEVV
jgi:hypothetical protein